MNGIRWLAVSLMAAWLALTLGGCARESSDRPAPVSGAGTVRPPRPIPVEKVVLRPLDASNFNEQIKQYQGKVLLVDFWATWCAPCRELFPHTRDLYQGMSDEGLTVISVSLDDMADESAVRKFLADQGANFDNYLVRDGTGEATWKALGVEGGIPHLKLFDREGNLRRSFPAPTDPEIKPAEVDGAVRELLAAPPRAG